MTPSAATAISSVILTPPCTDLKRRTGRRNGSRFAALNGYEEAVEEEARLTEREIDLDDSVREMINQTLVEAEEQLMRGETVRLSVTWFQPDVHKDGGAYRTAAGRLKKIDYYQQVLWLAEIRSGNQPGLENIGGEIAVNFPQICRVELIEEEVE